MKFPISLILVCLSVYLPVLAGGPWVPEPGDGYVNFGVSRKQANTSWDAFGHAFDNTGRTQKHDFRYGYLSGEAGILPKLSVTFLMTYLQGYEGTYEDLEYNAGLSDAWFGAKYQLAKGAVPMALSFTMRTAFFYDQPGPYSRNLYDSSGNLLGHSPEWRGVLKEDYTLGYSLGGSLANYRGWYSVDTGYTYRVGAPADEVPLSAEIGYTLPYKGLLVKGTTWWVFALGNDSPRQPNDRFGSRADFNFNDASVGRIGGSVIYQFGAQHRWWVEGGYNHWIWGQSARRYQEPFLSLGYKF